MIFSDNAPAEQYSMTPAERAKYVNDRAKEVIKEYGLKVQYKKQLKRGTQEPVRSFV